MRLLSLSIILFFLLHQDLQSFNEMEKQLWKVLPESYLSINGKTNLFSYQCHCKYFDGQDILIKEIGAYSGDWELEGNLSVQVNWFDCQNRKMNTDFKQTLNYITFPSIEIHFKKLYTDVGKNGLQHAYGEVYITIAGITRGYFIECDWVSKNSRRMQLTGVKLVRFSDFELDPPKKLFGFVWVEDEVNVTFNLTLAKL